MKNKNDLLSNNDSKSIEESDILTPNTSNSISQENMESKEEITHVISDEPIAPLTFLKANKKIIGLNQNQFKEWLKLNYIAFCGEGRFIPTKTAIDKAFMVIENDYTIKIKNAELTADIYISCMGKLTQKGQEYILSLFENESGANSE